MTTPIVVVNQSTLVTDVDAATMTEAVNLQLATDVLAAWKTTRNVIFLPLAQVPKDAYVISLFDDPDQAGALGWHTEGPNGLVYGRVFARPVLENAGNILTAPLSIASVLSHEAIETHCDIDVNLWADNGSGKLYARETGDPVESDSYTIGVAGVGITVSNFVFPNWFNPNAASGAKLDQMGKLTKPFEMTPGGYVVVMQEGQVSQEFGSKYPDWKKTTKVGASRTARRTHTA